jgi:anti-anti-sigma factor
MANLHVLRLDGEIDLAQKRRIERELAEIKGFGSEAVVILDLTDVGYVDTTFLNALISVRNHSAHAHREGSIRLVAPHHNSVWHLMEITKLDTVFPMFDSMAAARPLAFSEAGVFGQSLPPVGWSRTSLPATFDAVPAIRPSGHLMPKN